MSRRIQPLTLDRFATVPAPCRACLFWEMDPVGHRSVDDERALEAKEAWVSEVLREWGSCGRVASIDGQTVGFVLYAPPAFVPRVASFPSGPVSSDAVLMTTVWIDPRHAGGGIGRMLVQGMARDLIQRGGVRAVEAFGDVGPLSGIHGRRCAAPADFLARVGFKTHRPHPTVPRLRMDLKQTVTWRDDFEVAWERIREVVRPRPTPAPAPTEVRHETDEPDQGFM